MALFKCKMCGGTLEIKNETVAECEYCGTRQTIPRLDDERRANLYDRANHFRRNNEFDKAMGMYERILREDTTDAECYWSLVLCRYGIEYVEDPATHKRIPTVNRAQFTSIFDDDNYKSALRYADSSQRHIYEGEAKVINEIQKGILTISQKEDPFDVFICYKDTDHNGRRTPDSVLANDLYHQLTQEGFKVFFSRITLEDKLGEAYEPYIFAALNSAKVMVVLGTRPEYFNAVWVRNEWSRYLALIKNGAKKILIPAYRDMDPYDLPEEFSHLQAQDMSRLGFMQDLIRGIRKIAKAEEPQPAVVKETIIAGPVTGNTAPLLKRAFMFLEDEDWHSAREYGEKVLDMDPENARAYLVHLMAILHVSRREDLKNLEKAFDENAFYRKTIRFADPALKKELEGYLHYIHDRNKKEGLETVYNYSKQLMTNASTEDAYKQAARSFESISDYKDSEALARECCLKAENARKDTILAEGKAMMYEHTVSSFLEAMELFSSISGWKDADEKRYQCQQEIEGLKAAEEADRLAHARLAKVRARRGKIIAAAFAALTAIGLVVTLVIVPNRKYDAAMDLMSAEKYEDAIEAFSALDGYKDSEAQIRLAEDRIYEIKEGTQKEANYQKAIQLLKDGKHREAHSIFQSLGEYEDAAGYLSRFQEKRTYVRYTIPDTKYYNYTVDITYNAAGETQTKTKKYYQTGAKGYTQVAQYQYLYNDNGYVLDIEYSYPETDRSKYSDTTLVGEKYIYDAEDRLVEYWQIQHDGAIIRDYYLWLNESGQLISGGIGQVNLKYRDQCHIHMVDSSGQKIKCWNEKYDSQGNLTGEKFKEIGYTYDADGQLIEEIQYGEEAHYSATEGKTVYEVTEEITYFTYKDGKLISERLGDVSINYEYSDSGVEIRSVREQNGKVLSTLEYTYDMIYVPNTKD